MEAALIRSMGVFRKTGFNSNLQTVEFLHTSAWEEEGNRTPRSMRKIQMDQDAWRDMGEPDKITVTIEPGDRLNEGN